MKKTIFLFASALLFAANALAGGGADIYFQRPDGMPSSMEASCQGAVSPLKRNTVMTEVSGGNRTLWIKDVVNRRSNQFVVPAGDSRIEISDTGPTGYINVAYVRPLSSASARPYFSADSGATFSQLNPSGVAPFTQFMLGSFSGGGGTNSSNMKFGPDGNLYVFYFTKHTSLNQYNFNLQVFDKQGQSIGGPYVLSGATTPLAPTFGVSGTAAFVSTAVTSTSVIAVAKPGHWWDPSCGAGCYREDTVTAYVWDVGTQSLKQTVGLGHALVNSNYANSINPYGFSQNFGFNGSLITSDGNSIYYLNGIADVWDAGRGMFEPAMEVRRFPPLAGGKYFPENSGAAPIPYTDLSQIPAALNTSQFMDDDPGGSDMEIHNFAAPRYISNFTNKVDIMFESDVALSPVIEVKTARLNPDYSYSAQAGTVQILQDNTDASVKLVDPNAGVGNHGDVSLSSVFGGTAAMFCYPKATGAMVTVLHVCDIS